MLPLNPGALKVRARSAKVLAVWEGAGDTPAVVENHFGNGRSIYVSAQENAFGPGSPLLAELAGRLIGPAPVSIQASRWYYLVMNRQRDDLILCLLNRSTGSRGTFDPHGVAAARIPIEGPELVTVTVLEGLLGKIRSAELLDSKDQVNLSRQLGTAKIVFEASPSATLLRLRRDLSSG